MADAPRTTTHDSLYGGAIGLRQPAQGYRVNIDALLLAAFAAQARTAKFAVDLGAGVGSVALGLHHLGGAKQFALIDREASLLALADGNASQAQMPSRSFCCDLSQGLPSELRQSADLVVSNPPFFDRNHARPSPNAARTSARFGELSPFLEAAAAAIEGARARVCFIYPARELTRFLATAERAKLVPKRLRLVHADASRPARLALLELRHAQPGGLVDLAAATRVER